MSDMISDKRFDKKYKWRSIVGEGENVRFEETVVFSKCTRTNFCVDCDDPDCLLAGVVEADCPKWKCDNPSMNCENCEFLKEYKRGVT